ncbi:MAG TPA: hypothetical protein VHT29_05640 [Solirubrobacteraceae bacterium]|jgi:hypothetical protein|nr:hypothetical protein [Solirubrobacteraceae bacterium]
MRRLTTLAMLTLLVSGCGGGEAGASETGQVDAVVLRYFSAYARGSGAELCALLTRSAQHKMVEVVESDEQELGRVSSVRTCLQAVDFLGRVPQAENAKVISASIMGANATVTVKVGSLHAGAVTLSKTAAGWLVDKLPGEA